MQNIWKQKSGRASPPPQELFASSDITPRHDAKIFVFIDMTKYLQANLFR